MSRRELILLGIYIFFAAAYIHHPVEYDNTSSRYYLLSSVVDFGRFDIGRYKDETIDISVSGDRVYSNKAIGTPLAAVPVYAFLRKFTPIRGDAPLSPRAQYICRVVTTTIPYALSCVVMYRMLSLMGVSAIVALQTVFAYAFGTIAWIHAAMFSGHQMAASLAFLSFAAIWFASRTDSAKNTTWFGAGILAGLAGLSDYTAIVLAGFLAVYAFIKSVRPLQWTTFILGGGVMAAALMAYNVKCFGGPFSFSYAHLGYGEFAEGSKQGIMGVALPDIGALVQLLISPFRGVFFLMPVLLMSLPGFREWLKRPSPESPDFRWEARLALAAVVSYFFINAGFYGWHGGWTFGPRYLVPMLPFLAMASAFVSDRRWFFPLFAISLAQVGLAQFSVPHTPEVIRNPIVECVIPLLFDGYHPVNIGTKIGLPYLLSLIPVAAVSARFAWFYFRLRKAEEAAPETAPVGPADAMWRSVYVLACVAIALGLLAVRSPAPSSVHAYNTRLLGNAAYILRSNDLARAAMREDYLSKIVMP